jgi:hypothetical protein
MQTIRIVALLLALAGCSGGNVHTAADYHAPSPPPVRQPLYDPYAAYGSAPAVWQPPVADRRGTIARPSDPSVDRDRPWYESAPWAADISPVGGPPGTF